MPSKKRLWRGSVRQPWALVGQAQKLAVPRWNGFGRQAHAARARLSGVVDQITKGRRETVVLRQREHGFEAQASRSGVLRGL